MVDQLWAKAPANLILDPTLTLADLRVYLYLDLRAGRRGWWWGTQREISERLSVTSRSVSRAVAKLRARGYISTRQTENLDGTIAYAVHARTGSTLPLLEPVGSDIAVLPPTTPVSYPPRQGRPNRRDGVSTSGSRIRKITTTDHSQSVFPSGRTDWSAIMQAHRDKLDEAAG